MSDKKPTKAVVVNSLLLHPPKVEEEELEESLESETTTTDEEFMDEGSKKAIEEEARAQVRLYIHDHVDLHAIVVELFTASVDQWIALNGPKLVHAEVVRNLAKNPPKHNVESSITGPSFPKHLSRGTKGTMPFKRPRNK